MADGPHTRTVHIQPLAVLDLAERSFSRGAQVAAGFSELRRIHGEPRQNGNPREIVQPRVVRRHEHFYEVECLEVLTGPNLRN